MSKYLNHMLFLKGGIIILLISLTWALPLSYSGFSDALIFAGVAVIMGVGFTIIGDKNGEEGALLKYE